MERDSKGKFVKGSYIRLDGKQFGYLTVLQTTRENNHRVTINGTTHTISEWCKIIGINTSIVNGRIYKGWSDLEALTIPKGGKRQ